MLNQGVSLRGCRLLMVPYMPHHVPRYHQWMSDPALLEATCSEQQTLEEEYANQQSWLAASDKLTFILLAPLSLVVSDELQGSLMGAARSPVMSTTEGQTTEQGQPLPQPQPSRDFATPTPCSSPPAEGSAPLPAETGTKQDANGRRVPYVMIGDCNLFAIPSAEEGEMELSVMIADPLFRGKGLAQEAVGLMMTYAAEQLHCLTFVAKILADNEPSRRLFESPQLGFSIHKEVKVFNEVHYLKRLVGQEEVEEGTPAATDSTPTTTPCRTVADIKAAFRYTLLPYDRDRDECNTLPAVPPSLLQQ